MRQGSDSGVSLLNGGAGLCHTEEKEFIFHLPFAICCDVCSASCLGVAAGANKRLFFIFISSTLSVGLPIDRIIRRLQTLVTLPNSNWFL